jgi:Second Messenger Oligonucleotide or Dinucleotide Synthetase domain
MLTLERETTHQLGTLLGKISEDLDIPPDAYALAVAAYEQVGNWLGQDDNSETCLAEYQPKLYPQGSFRLGTIIRPLGRADYDVDLVCRLEIGKEQTTQKELKHLVGDRLKNNQEYEKILKEGRRCWTLLPNKLFHMDVLPSVPDRQKHPESIFITDKELLRWQLSNPIGYADWFKERMKTQFEEQRMILAKATGVDIEKIPDWQIRTPLQRVIQLLKRHRDIRFQKDLDDKPISIIITTLAAKAYKGETDIVEALLSVTPRMKEYIEEQDGIFYVCNPVNKNENFADKWKDYPERQEKFFGWLDKVVEDMEKALKGQSTTILAKSLSEGFGEDVVQKAFGAYGNLLKESRDKGTLGIITGSGTVSASGKTKIPEHNFYGDISQKS